MINLELTRSFLLRNWRLAALVAAGAGMLACFLTFLFPAMDPETVAAIAAGWPPLVRRIFGDPMEGFATVTAWMNMQFFHIAYWVIFGGLLSILAARVVAGEIEHKTLDVLLSYPPSRGAILWSRALAIVLLAAGAMLPVVAGCAVGVLLTGERLTPVPLLAVVLNGMLLSLVCAGLTLAVSTVWPSQIMAIAVSMAVFGVLFFSEALLVPLLPELAWASLFNPFHYYRSAEVLAGSVVPIGDLLFLAATGLALLVLAQAVFNRKDVPP